MQKKLPIGIENFEDMIKENYYYVDKTGLLKQLLNEHGLVNLFTRPRRFGKSLNMSMLKYWSVIEKILKLFSPVKMLSLAILKQPVNTAMYRLSFVFNDCFNMFRSKMIISL